MKRVFLAAGLLLAAQSAVAPQAHAIGCLSGAALGGMAGHVAGHHAILGAIAGCAVGHHAASTQRENARQVQQQQADQQMRGNSYQQPQQDDNYGAKPPPLSR